MLELLQSVKTFCKKKYYYLQQWVSCSGKVKISKEHMSQTHVPPETFYTTSSLEENSFFSQMRTWPPHSHPHISHFQAKLSQLTAIRSENWSNFLKISVPAWQNIAAFLPAKDLPTVSAQPSCKGMFHRAPKPTSAAVPGSWQWGKHSSNTDCFPILSLLWSTKKKKKKIK